jgi:hypothetical protein
MSSGWMSGEGGGVVPPSAPTSCPARGDLGDAGTDDVRERGALISAVARMRGGDRGEAAYQSLAAILAELGHRKNLAAALRAGPVGALDWYRTSGAYASADWKVGVYGLLAKAVDPSTHKYRVQQIQAIADDLAVAHAPKDLVAKVREAIRG